MLKNRLVRESETPIGQERNQEEFIATESIIGEYGLAWIGSIVLVLGIAFLMVYSQNRGFSILSSSIGFGAVAIIFIGAYKFRKSFSYLSLMLYISGFILVYYTVLKLYFFTPLALLPWGRVLILPYYF